MKRFFNCIYYISCIIKLSILLKIKSICEKEIEKMQRSFIKREFKNKLKEAKIEEEKHEKQTFN